MVWEKGDEVRRVDNPGKVGILTGKTQERNGLKYFFVKWPNGTKDWVEQSTLERIEDGEDNDDWTFLLDNGRYGRYKDLRRNLTHIHLSGKLANLVYSMGITNTDFYPHQYKPLLTLLNSSSDGLLIADEVGLGKTIEAGLIWTELRARDDLQRLLIVCPAVLREKWRDELKNRFGIDSQIVDSKTLVYELESIRELGGQKAWITSYQAIRPPRGWDPDNPDPMNPSGTQKLARLLYDNAEDKGLIDLVIFDEAHYMRNSTSTANKLGEMLQKVSRYRILLSATPINLRNNDLFNLLKICIPEQFQYKAIFDEMISSNAPLKAAHDAVLNPSASAEDIIQNLIKAKETPLFSDSRQLAMILENPPNDSQLEDKRFRAGLASDLEKIDLLGHVLTRTLKREVDGNRPERKVLPEKVPFTEAEQSLYEYVTEIVQEYAEKNNLLEGFLLVMPQRQVCSCPSAFLTNWLQAGGLTEFEGYQDDEDIAITNTKEATSSLRQYIHKHFPRSIDINEILCHDSKFLRTHEILKEFFSKNPQEKVIIFTSFRNTANYLCSKLNESGFPAISVMGGMQDSKQEIITRFKDDPRMRVIVATEVASEGVDLQFCRFLINYDLPWNPMRIEQRIGRIDRLGQQSPVLNVWNMFYKDSIDDRIFTRLLSRLEIFKEALGELEPIVGQTVSKLEIELLTQKLTEKEKWEKIEKAALALENVRKKREELEKNASQMMAHGKMVLERIAAADELSRRVTESDLVIYVQDYLNQYATGHQFIQKQGYEYDIKLPPIIAGEFDDFCRKRNIINQTRLGTGNIQSCRFANKLTSQGKKGQEVIHQFHPLIRFIGKELVEKNETFYPLVSLRVKKTEERLPAGIYAFAIKKWTFTGIKTEEWLQTAMKPLEDGIALKEEDADFLINHARLNGEDWIEAPNLIESTTVENALFSLEQDLASAFNTAKEKKQIENEDRKNFQLKGLEQYYEMQLERLEEVLQKHIESGNKGLKITVQMKIDKLKHIVHRRREEIQKNSNVIPDDHCVSVGIIELYD